ncbi:hypothetical protein KJ853_02150 [Patescibacteria group bacterium]|nr:hypothetical protein [Patescibacteria group bacterium]
MRKLVSFVFVLMLGAVFAQTVVAAEKQFSADANLAFVSKYIGGMSGSTAFNDFAIQPSFTVTHNRTGIYGRAWTSYSPQGGYNSDSGDEVDWYLGARKEVSGFVLDAGAFYCDVQKFFNIQGDLYGLYLNIDFPSFKGLTPYLYLEGDGSVKDAEGGYLYRAGLRYGFSPAPKLPSFGVDVSVAGHDGAYGSRPELVSSARASLFSTIKWKGAGISPQINFQKRLGYSPEEGGLTNNEFWYGINFSYQF